MRTKTSPPPSSVSAINTAMTTTTRLTGAPVPGCRAAGATVGGLDTAPGLGEPPVELGFPEPATDPGPREPAAEPGLPEPEPGLPEPELDPGYPEPPAPAVEVWPGNREVAVHDVLEATITPPATGAWTATRTVNPPEMSVRATVGAVAGASVSRTSLPAG